MGDSDELRESIMQDTKVTRMIRDQQVSIQCQKTRYGFWWATGDYKGRLFVGLEDTMEEAIEVLIEQIEKET